MAPLVSILVNNYNYEQFIGEAIENGLSQTYGNEGYDKPVDSTDRRNTLSF
jgi:hypothetical protein